MIEIKYVKTEDKEFWYSLDSHLSEEEFKKKIRDKQGYVLYEDEDAQHFYRKLGYKDCGGFTVDIPGFEQPMELIMSKSL